MERELDRSDTSVIVGDIVLQTSAATRERRRTFLQNSTRAVSTRRALGAQLTMRAADKQTVTFSPAQNRSVGSKPSTATSDITRHSTVRVGPNEGNSFVFWNFVCLSFSFFKFHELLFVLQVE
jgi:hypothetical protein